MAPRVVQRKRVRSSVPPSARPGCAPWLGSDDQAEWPFVPVLVATRSSPLLAHALIMGLSAGVVVQRIPAKRMFAASERPSASLPSPDVLFPTSDDRRNGAECGRFGPFFRTTRGGPEAHFGPFSVSLCRVSPTQPNHARFGTDVRSSQNQSVRESPRGRGFERAALRRSRLGSKRSGFVGGQPRRGSRRNTLGPRDRSNP
jgi:hypothetical protein